jgi:hypothetical protein
MVFHTPDNGRSLPDPDEVAEQLANQLEQNGQLREDLPERVRTSETPLAVPTGDSISSTGSLRSVLRYCVLKGVQDIDEVVRVSFNKVDVEQWASVTTHPSLLEQSNRLLSQAALAKAYQYGYWPNGWRTVEGGSLPESVDSVAGLPYEQRELELVWKDNDDKIVTDTTENWFADEDAVTEFASRFTDDDISWSQYAPWYRTTAVSTYRLNQVAQTTDWTEFPDHPDVHPNIENRFDTSTKPPVGDFIRMAVLRKLERSLPIITNLSTGPDPWATDRVSLVVDPTAAEGRPDGGILCLHVVLKKLAEYGYRPIDGWYDAPAIGYESDDPIEPRRIEFARGHALQTWCERIQMQSPLFDDATKVRETGYLPNVDWQTFIPCVRSQIITYQELHDLAQNPETLF